MSLQPWARSAPGRPPFRPQPAPLFPTLEQPMVFISFKILKKAYAVAPRPGARVLPVRDQRQGQRSRSRTCGLLCLLLATLLLGPGPLAAQATSSPEATREPVSPEPSEKGAHPGEDSAEVPASATTSTPGALEAPPMEPSGETKEGGQAHPEKAGAAQTSPPPGPLEWRILPVVGGNTDMGVLLGGILLMSGLGEQCTPYCWHASLQLSASFKKGPEGLELPVHQDYVSLDLPGLWGGRLRLYPELNFYRIINAGYFGVGNASRQEEDTSSGQTSGRRYQGMLTDASLRSNARLTLGGHGYLMLGLRGRYLVPGSYAGSLLEADMAAQEGNGQPRLYGTTPHASLLVSAGLVSDSRDHEIFTHGGFYHEVGLRLAPCPLVGTNLCYGGVSVNSRGFRSLAGDYLTVAAQVFGDVLFGRVPYYELPKAGAFTEIALFGSSKGVRGIPDGRYQGLSKVMGSLEVRSMFLPIRVFGQYFQLGAAGFVDAGRVWAHHGGEPGLDGEGLGLKVGYGLGPRLRWGETMMIRYDFAWSAEAAALTPDTPYAMYLELGEAF